MAIVIDGLIRMLHEMAFEGILKVEDIFRRHVATRIISKRDFERLVRWERRIALGILTKEILL